MKLFFIICDASEGQISKRTTSKPEVLVLMSRHLGFMIHLASHTVGNSFSEFFGIKNRGIAVGILQLRCIEAEI